jgi:hypothetical protein
MTDAAPGECAVARVNPRCSFRDGLLLPVVEDLATQALLIPVLDRGCHVTFALLLESLEFPLLQAARSSLLCIVLEGVVHIVLRLVELALPFPEVDLELCICSNLLDVLRLLRGVIPVVKIVVDVLSLVVKVDVVSVTTGVNRVRSGPQPRVQTRLREVDFVLASELSKRGHHPLSSSRLRDGWPFVQNASHD